MARLFQFKVIRGADLIQEFPVRLDQNRVLDGTETWRFVVRKDKPDSAALIELTSGAGEIGIDSTTFEPYIIFESATPTLNTTDFPPSNQNIPHWCEMEMTKDGKVEKDLGIMIVISDVAR